MNLETAMAGNPFRDTYRTSPKRFSLPPETINPIIQTIESLFQLSEIDPNDRDDFPKRLGPTHTILRSLKSVLTPEQIQISLASLQPYERERDYSTALGLIITRLVQNAHYRGHTDFVLDFNGQIPINYVCHELKEKNNSQLRVRIKGTLGSHAAEGCRGGTYYFDTVGRECGGFSDDTTYYIRAAGSEPGDCADRCSFYIERLNVISEHNFLDGAERVSHSTFYTPDLNVEQYLKKYKGAKVLFERDWERHWPKHTYGDKP